MFNLKKLNEVEGKEQYCVEISNRFAALVNKAWETITENINISAKESLGYNEPSFNEGCSKLLDQRKQAKLKWLQDPGKFNGDNLNNKIHETSRHFRNKKRQYLKDKTDELAANTNFN
jgi:hypothetical protein